MFHQKNVCCLLMHSVGYVCHKCLVLKFALTMYNIVHSCCAEHTRHQFSGRRICHRNFLGAFPLVQRERQWHEFRAHFRLAATEGAMRCPDIVRLIFKLAFEGFCLLGSFISIGALSYMTDLKPLLGGQGVRCVIPAKRRPRFPQKATLLPLSSSSSTTAACHSQLSQRDEGGKGRPCLFQSSLTQNNWE